MKTHLASMTAGAPSAVMTLCGRLVACAPMTTDPAVCTCLQCLAMLKAHRWAQNAYHMTTLRK